MCAATGLALATASVAHIGSNLAEELRPDLASAWWPGNDRALARQGEFALLEAQIQPKGNGPELTSGNAESLEEAKAHARAGLRVSGLQSGALRVLAIAALAAGDEEESTRWANFAEQLTRRDARIQLLLFRRALLDRRMAAGLRHFDLAMRSDQQMRVELYPPLAQSMRDEETRNYFAPYIRADNPWLADFLVYALNEGPAPDVIGQVIAEANELPVRPGLSIEEIAVPRMVQLGHPVLARTISERLSPARRPAPSGGLSNPAFSFDDQTILPFGWSMSNRPELTIRLSSSGANGGLTIGSTGSFGAELARQLLTLPPGPYRLEVEGATLDRARWTMTCSGGAAPLVQNAGLGTYRFTVPGENCEGQWLRLDADGSGVVDVELARLSVDAITSTDR